MSRTDLIHRAVLAFLEYGRGAVVILLDDPEPIYVRADEAVAQLTEWRAEAQITEAVARATTDYDPEHEAVVVCEDAISFTVSIERREGIEAIGSINWSPSHSRVAANSSHGPSSRWPVSALALPRKPCSPST